MIQCALMAVWLAGAVPACADSAGTAYREAAPVVTVIPPSRAVPAGEDPYGWRKALLVDVILGLSGMAALYLTAHKVVSERRNRPRGRSGTRSVLEDGLPEEEVSATVGEMAENRRSRRAWHAAEIERLLRRL